MRNVKKRCSMCGRWYQPDKRTRQHQTCCRQARCRKKRKACANKSWRTRHPGYDKSRKLKKRDWAQKGHYWRQYRQTHPAYVQRDNQRRRASRRRAKNAANQDAMRKISVEQLVSIPRCEPQNAANQALMDRRVDRVVDCLLDMLCAARQDGISTMPRSMP